MSLHGYIMYTFGGALCAIGGYCLGGRGAAGAALMFYVAAWMLKRCDK